MVWTPARLALVRLIGLLRGAKKRPAEFLQVTFPAIGQAFTSRCCGGRDLTHRYACRYQVQQLIVEHQLPDIIAQCTRVPFSSGCYAMLEPKAGKGTKLGEHSKASSSNREVRGASKVLACAPCAYILCFMFAGA